jgi:hypothetical protein
MHIEVEIELQEDAMSSELSGRARLRPLREMLVAAADEVTTDCGLLSAKYGSEALAEWSELINERQHRIL